MSEFKSVYAHTEFHRFCLGLVPLRFKFRWDMRIYLEDAVNTDSPHIYRNNRGVKSFFGVEI